MWFKLSVNDSYYWTVCFDPSLCDLDFDSRSQGCKKRKIFCANYLPNLLTDLDGISHAVETFWSYQSHSHFTSSSLYSREWIQLRWFQEKNQCWPAFGHLDIDFFQTWCYDRHQWALYFDTILSVHSLHSRPRLYEKTKTFCALFLAKCAICLDEIWCAAMTFWSVQACTVLLSHGWYSWGKAQFQWYWREFRIDLGLGAFEPIFFKFGMMMDMTTVYILIPVWMTKKKKRLIFTQGIE